MNRIRTALIAGLFGALAIVGFSQTAEAATTSTYTSYAQSDRLYEHAGSVTYTCSSDGSIALLMFGSEEAGAGDGHSLTATINGSVLAVTALRDGDGYGYSYAGTIDRTTGDWVMTAYNDAALQQGVTGGGHFNDLPDCAVTPPNPVGNHGQCVSGATKAGIKGNALAAIAKDETKVGPYGTSAACPKVA